MAMGGRVLTVVGSVVALGIGATAAYLITGGGHAVANVEIVSKTQPEALTLVRSERAYPLSGVVMSGGVPLADATVTAGSHTAYTDITGAFSFDNAPLGAIAVERPGYLPVAYDFDGSVEEADISMEVRIVRAIRAVPTMAGDDAAFQRLIDLAKATTVNALVFDTKADHDGGLVFYDTKVPAATASGLVQLTYDAQARNQQAHEAGLYTLTRIPTFLDPAYAAAYPAHVLAGDWLDPGNRDYWEYPLALAVEACELGFDEIQFDYVRYPSGSAATQARSAGKVPDAAGRTANIKAYLEEAVARLHPLGCAVSADIFGVVNAIEDDQGIGQLVEEVSAPIDVYSPMIYPEQWSAGWFGLSNPSNQPGALVTAVLNSALPRVHPGTIVRPWLQSYYYSGANILAQITAAEAQGLGWILWNSPGNYSTSGLPADPDNTE